ncbi:hypothetical protein LTR95_016887 [Oleoguttula sp. CCFEE 5521]
MDSELAADDKTAATDKHAGDDMNNWEISEESAAREKEQTEDRAKAEEAGGRKEVTHGRRVTKDFRIQQREMINKDATTGNKKIYDEQRVSKEKLTKIASEKNTSKDAPDVKPGHDNIGNPGSSAEKPPRRLLTAEQRAALTPEESQYLNAVENTGKLLDDVEELTGFLQRNEAETSRLEGWMKSIEDEHNLQRQGLSDTKAPNPNGCAG